MAQEQHEVHQLFTQQRIPEIKNHVVELAHELSTINDKFNHKMAQKYWDILEVTDEVSTLTYTLKEVDKEFGELCYNDDLYQLRKLPDLVVQSHTKSPLKQGSIEDDETSSSMILVELTEWAMAVYNFISKMPTTTSEPGVNNLIDNLMEHFAKIHKQLDNIISNKTYERVLATKCNQLQRYIVDAVTKNELYFTLFQWVKLNKIMEYSGFPWNVQIHEVFEKSLYGYIFEEEQDLDYIVSSSTNELVKTFVRSEKFQNSLIAHTKESIEQKLKELVELMKEDKQASIEPNAGKIEIDGILYPHTISDHVNIQEIINTGNMYSMGLDSKIKMKIFEVLNDLIQQIRKLGTYKCDKTLIARYKKDLLEILESVNIKDKKISTTQLTTLIGTYNSSKLAQLVNSQIQAIINLSQD